MSTKVNKPYYNVRLANRLQASAKEMQANKQALIEAEQAKIDGTLKTLSESTFTRVKSKAVQRREANQQRLKSFNESLTHMIASIAYNAMPVENKAPLFEEIDGTVAPSSAFTNMTNAVRAVMTKDPQVSMAVGDLYSRNTTIDLGSTTAISASQMAVGLSSAYNPLGENITKTCVKLHDNPDQAAYSAQNFVDQLLSFGDIMDGQDKQKGNLVVESLYEQFINSAVEQVEQTVLTTLKEETDNAELTAFLSESAEDDIYASRSNRNLTRAATKPTVFREIFKTVKVLAENVEFRPEMLMSEAIAQYTLMETLNAIGFLKKDKEQLIRECLEARREKRLAQ
jgi:hypothetical protein